MKFTIERDHFKNGLAQVAGVVGGKNTAPQLNNVHIEAAGESIALTTNNLDVGVRARVKASVSTSGVITLPVKLLSSIIASLPDKNVTLEVNSQNRATILSGSSRFNIIGLPEDNFPQLGKVDSGLEFEVPSADVAVILKKVSHAQSTDEGRFILNGVFFEFGAGKLAVAATDGRRLATAGKAIAGADELSGKFVLPSRSVTEVLRILAGSKLAKIAFNERQVTFTASLSEETSKDTGLVENIHLISKLVDGNYPNYAQVIPKETVHHLKIERALLLKSIELASVVLTEKSKTLKLTFGDNLIHIVGESSENGDGSSDVAVAYDGPQLKIAFNPEFLRASLDALNDDMITFEFKDELSPGVVKGSDNFLCVIMPQRSTN
ncbi:MAG: DNA polymerase III subunit beta [Puniceicoccales bacterium]|jgi:DNA polymerase-3 subunit beta|nr:DNA polymerase III subunit beta [Puniceicoccales bacterium]